MARFNAAKTWKMTAEVRRMGLRFNNADEFVDLCQAYFNFIDRNPLLGVELVKHQGSHYEADIPLGRPYSVDGLCAHLGVSESYFRTAKSQIKDKIEGGTATATDKEMLQAFEYIEGVIRTQQLEGAAVDIFKGGIVARWLSLADNVNTNAETVIRVNVRDSKTADNLDKLNDLL